MHQTEAFQMTQKEIERLEVLRQVKEGQLKQKTAAQKIYRQPIENRSKLDGRF